MAASKKILIIDDDEVFTESNRALLEDGGYEVHSAVNGSEGLALARQIKPHLIILDVMMSTNTEGFDVAREIPQVSELRNTNVLMVTGISKAMRLPDKVKPDEVWLPADKVLEKPIPPKKLLSEVRRMLR